METRKSNLETWLYHGKASMPFGDFGFFWYPFNIDVSHVQKRAVSVAFA